MQARMRQIRVCMFVCVLCVYVCVYVNEYLSIQYYIHTHI